MALLVVIIILVGAEFVFAISTKQYYGGPGGVITGTVIGVDGHPFDWATIYASNGQQVYEAFSGMSGVYQMRVPAGTYSVTVKAQGYTGNAATVSVTDNSSSTVNFSLEQAVPEFPTLMAPLLISLAATLILISRKAPRTK
jgi:O-acetylhomoserine/O-acetylserine sulfhydrylase-like pyridoxal-dependent enzyme